MQSRHFFCRSWFYRRTWVRSEEAPGSEGVSAGWNFLCSLQGQVVPHKGKDDSIAAFQAPKSMNRYFLSQCLDFSPGRVAYSGAKSLDLVQYRSNHG